MGLLDSLSDIAVREGVLARLAAEWGEPIQNVRASIDECDRIAKEEAASNVVLFRPKGR